MIYSENAIKVYQKLYFDKNLKETLPEQAHYRIGMFIGNSKEEKDTFIDILNKKIFRPNTPCMIHAGIEQDNLCACFVLKLEDTMESIIDLWAITAKIYASGAGAGFRMTSLREAGSPLSKGGMASGPAAYIQVNECVSNTVKSGGKHRRAANIGVLDYNHPDFLDIINIKKNGGLSSFNLSALVDDFFMKNIVDIKESINETGDFPVKQISPNPMITNLPTMSGIHIWDSVIQNAWETGDPGLLFLENLNKGNPFPNRGLITCTNPCGEVPLFDDSSCVIGSINVNAEELYSYINDIPVFNWEIFKTVIHDSIKFLNNIIDKTTFLHPRFEAMMKKIRPIGLGIMGFADMLVKLNIEYGSQSSIEFLGKLSKFLNLESIRKSIDLCAKAEIEFIPMTKKEKIYFKELLRYFDATDEDIKLFDKHGIANCTWTCFAPTGSISISADCNYSWEPISAIIWKKELAESGEIMDFFYPEFEKWIETEYLKNFHDSYLPQNQKFIKDKLIEKIKENCGSIKGLKEIPEEIQKRFRVAHDISPKQKIKMQAAAQRWISLGISSTCNLPNSATKEDIEEIYILAYELGLKGITVYRDGCKKNQPINFGKKKELIIVDDVMETTKEFTPEELENFRKTWITGGLIPTTEKSKRRERPIEREGRTTEIKTPYGKLFVTLNKYPDGSPMEIWLNLGGAGHHENILYDQLARAISTGLQYGIDVEKFISQLRSTKEVKFWFKPSLSDNNTVSADSVSDAIGILMEKYFLEAKEKKETIFDIPKEDGGYIFPDQKAKKEIMGCLDICPECHMKSLNRNTGCRGGFCETCGFSNCS